jgi:hypothetical protein
MFAGSVTSAAPEHVVETPVSVFLDFDPGMVLPQDFAWKKEARPMTIGSRQTMADLASEHVECLRARSLNHA